MDATHQLASIRPRSSAPTAPMPPDRQRFTFLRSVGILARAGEDALWNLASMGRDAAVAPGAAVQLGGGGHGTVGIVQSGELLVTVASGVIARLVPGDLFGDSTLVPEHHRGATLRASEVGAECVLIASLDFHLELAHALLTPTELLSRDAHGPIEDRPLTIYNDLPMRDLAIVRRDARLEQHNPGDAIVTQGDVGDRFHIVLRGAVLVELDDAPLVTLGRGDHFGELALLTDAPRAATVRAISATQTWSVSRIAFERILAFRLSAAPDAAARDLAAGRGPGGALGSPLAARLRNAR